MTGVFDWQGKVGNIWAAEWQRTDRSFAELTNRLHNAITDVAPQSGRAVDIGCGAGETSIALARARPGLAVTGIDLSDDLLEVARRQAVSVDNVSFVHGDVADAAADFAPVDIYVSRHGVMFFDDPAVAFAALRTAASPGCPMIFSCFREWTLNGFAYEMRELSANVAPKEDAPGPFAFADKDKVAGILHGSGWKNAEAVAVDVSYIAGEGDDPVGDAVSFMRRIGPASRLIADAAEDQRPGLIEGLRRICEQHQAGNRVVFPAAIWIWSANA
jgi:SAM-dependent methyltransferase